MEFHDTARAHVNGTCVNPLRKTRISPSPSYSALLRFRPRGGVHSQALGCEGTFPGYTRDVGLVDKRKRPKREKERMRKGCVNEQESVYIYIRIYIYDYALWKLAIHDSTYVSHVYRISAGTFRFESIGDYAGFLPR